VSALFGLLNSSDIHYAVLHGAECVPDRVASDIDMVMDSGSLEKVHSILTRYAAERGGVLCQAIEHEPTACYWVLALPGRDSRPSYVKVDISSDFRRDGRVLFTGAELLEGSSIRGMTWSVSTGTEFAAYLAKCVLKRRISKEQLDSLRALWRKDEDSCLRQLHLVLDLVTADLVAGTMNAPDSTRTIASLLAIRPRILRRSFLRHPFETLVYPFRHVIRSLGRTARRTGFQVAVLGPDGVGKSAVMAQMGAYLAPAFRAQDGLHLRPGLLPPRASSTSGTNNPIPYTKEPYGASRSIAKLVYLMTDYILGYWTLVWPKLVRSTLVVCDRYFLDVVADPIRYRYAGPRGLLSMCRRIVPGPDLYLVLEAPVETIQARKAEVSAAKTLQQLQGYKFVAAGDPKVISIEASGSVDAVTLAAVDLVLRRLGDRLARR